MALPATGRRSAAAARRPWRLLDLFMAALFLAVFLFFTLLLTPLGDPLAASGRRALSAAAGSDLGRRIRILSAVEAGGPVPLLEACPGVAVNYVPCVDPRRFDGERRCPAPEEAAPCLIPPPAGYRTPVRWPESLQKIWHDNIAYSKIAERKDHLGGVKEEGPYWIFLGGETMFPDGAVQYIEKLGQYLPLSGGILRTALDMGCGAASFGGHMLHKNILTLSFAPGDSQDAQIQFALERGIPAFVATLGTHRLPLPAQSFDLVHCSRCLIPYTSYNGTYFIEVDRLLRPGGYFVISGPPVQWQKEDKEWADLQSLAKALCYDLIVVDGNTVIWKKPSAESCFPIQNDFEFDLCSDSDDPNHAWYTPLKHCVSNISSVEVDHAVGAIPNWPERLIKPPARINLIKNGIEVFEADTRRWVRRVAYYKHTLGTKLGTASVHNVMDMNAFFGGFAAALSSDPVWVMNVVPSHKSSTLGVIHDRGFIGVYHDWCEPFSTYPRTYDFIHVDGIESVIKGSSSGNKRCHLVDVIVELDRILRPEGTVLVRDMPEVIDKVSLIARAAHWVVTVHDPEQESVGRGKILVATKKLGMLRSTNDKHFS